MATTITGKLNKAASQFQAGDSTGFGLRLGVKYFDRETNADAWTNYEAVVFAKAPGQIQFYQNALVEGAIVEVSGDQLAIKQFQGNNGLSLSIQILNAKLGFVFSPNAAPQQQQQNRAPAQQQQNRATTNRPGLAQQQGYNQQQQNRATTNRPGLAQQQGYNQQQRGPGSQQRAPAQQQGYNQPQCGYDQQHQQQQNNQQFQQQFDQNGNPLPDFDDDIPY